MRSSARSNLAWLAMLAMGCESGTSPPSAVPAAVSFARADGGDGTAAKPAGSSVAPGEPDSERRDQPVDEQDLKVLERADAILASEPAWNRADDRRCPAEVTKWSLFCALQKASVEVTGKYEHRRAALQEVRFAVEDATRGRDFKHRMMEFNNLPETKFSDVKRVLAQAKERVRSKLARR